jgi:hypothetical protein
MDTHRYVDVDEYLDILVVCMFYDTHNSNMGVLQYVHAHVSSEHLYD